MQPGRTYGPMRGAGLLDVAQVGRAVAQRGRHGDHADVEALGVRRTRVLGRYRPLPSAAAEPVGRDVLDEGLAGGQPLDPVGVDVEADDVVSGLDRPHGQRQADVSLADDDQLLSAHPGSLRRRNMHPRQRKGYLRLKSGLGMFGAGGKAVTPAGSVIARPVVGRRVAVSRLPGRPRIAPGCSPWCGGGSAGVLAVVGGGVGRRARRGRGRRPAGSSSSARWTAPARATRSAAGSPSGWPGPRRGPGPAGRCARSSTRPPRWRPGPRRPASGAAAGAVGWYFVAGSSSPSRSAQRGGERRPAPPARPRARRPGCRAAGRARWSRRRVAVPAAGRRGWCRWLPGRWCRRWRRAAATGTVLVGAEPSAMAARAASAIAAPVANRSAGSFARARPPAAAPAPGSSARQLRRLVVQVPDGHLRAGCPR